MPFQAKSVSHTFRSYGTVLPKRRDNSRFQRNTNGFWTSVWTRMNEVWYLGGPGMKSEKKS